MLQQDTTICPLVLITPDGDITVNAVYTILHDPDHSKYVENPNGEDYVLYDVKEASVQVEWDGQIFRGHCTDELYTEKALRTLAETLPEGIKLKSCLTCRHGNFCPFGSNDNEIFCVSDFRPTKKTDLDFIFLADSREEGLKRRRSLFHVCSNYQPESAEYWSYK